MRRLCSRVLGGFWGLLPARLSQQQAGRPLSTVATKLLVLHPASSGVHSLQEALRLGESYCGSPPAHLSLGSAARHQRPHPATFLGRGQLEAAAAQVAAAQPAAVFFNAALSGVQQRQLERHLGRPVLDRMGLIIAIFSQRARTSEARLQVELAALEYKASRLVRIVDATTGRCTAFGLAGEEAEIVSARERGRSGGSSGGLGAGGGQGESELQLQRRRIADRRKQLLRRLEAVRKTRAVQRAARRRSGKPQVAIVGYTNAGKSSLLHALCGTGEDLGVDDRLFATLDPTLRRVRLLGGRDVILSDTVGFISGLPTQLVEAFKATLEEVTEADLLLHVLDASSPAVLQQRAAVLRVLRELGLSDAALRSRVVEVWNKLDLVPGGEQQLEQQRVEQQEQQAPATAAGAAEEAGSRAQAAASAGMLPPPVETLLQADARAAAYRPMAVATCVVHRRGLHAVLAAVEGKLGTALAGRQEQSRGSAKRAAAELEHAAAEEDGRLWGAMGRS